MATITLMFKEKEIQKFPLKNDRLIKIGRRNDNQIMIDNVSVSGYHAEISTDGNTFQIKDLKSKNGTFVNQQLITSPCLLSQDDVITIGKHELVFSLKDETVGEKHGSPAGGGFSSEKTQFLDTYDHRELLKKFASTSHKAPLVSLQFKGKLIRKYLLKANTDFTIGRLSENDVVIDNSAVSGRHASINLEGDAFVIKDLNSTNGVYINDNPVSTARLNDGDVIKIGKHDLVFSIMGDFEPGEIRNDPNSGPSMAFSSEKTTFIDKKQSS